jgi:hypothetical protein
MEASIPPQQLKPVFNKIFDDIENGNFYKVTAFLTDNGILQNQAKYREFVDTLKFFFKNKYGEGQESRLNYIIKLLEKERNESQEVPRELRLEKVKSKIKSAIRMIPVEDIDILESNLKNLESMELSSSLLDSREARDNNSKMLSLKLQNGKTIQKMRDNVLAIVRGETLIDGQKLITDEDLQVIDGKDDLEFQTTQSLDEYIKSLKTRGGRNRRNKTKKYRKMNYKKTIKNNKKKNKKNNKKKTTKRVLKIKNFIRKNKCKSRKSKKSKK